VLISRVFLRVSFPGEIFFAIKESGLTDGDILLLSFMIVLLVFKLSLLVCVFFAVRESLRKAVATLLLSFAITLL